MRLIAARSRFACVGLMASVVIVTGLAGCDSAPAPPNEPSPPMPKVDQKVGKGTVKSIKNRQQYEQPAPKP